MEYFVGLRYLFSRKREGFISLITFLSFMGITLGVMALIVVMSVMNGFKQELMKQLMGMQGHVVMYPVYQPINYDHLTQKIMTHTHVDLALPMIEQPTVLGLNDKFDNLIIVQGHDIELLKKHDYIKKNVVEGSIDALKKPDTIMIGKRLAETLGARIGDKLELLDPKGEETFLGSCPKFRKFELVAIFELGMRHYDKSFVFVPLESAQDFFGFHKNITHIEVFTHPTEGIAKPLMLFLKDPNLRIQDRALHDESLFQALNVEKNVMFVVLTLMILIAVLNIVSSLIMLVKDKHTDIAILRTIGASRRSIVTIFFINGAAIGLSGTLVGLAAGLVFSFNIEAIRGFIERMFSITLFDPKVYYLSHLPSIVSLSDVFFVCAVSLLFSFLATLYPALKAATLDPVKILR